MHFAGPVTLLTAAYLAAAAGRDPAAGENAAAGGAGSTPATAAPGYRLRPAPDESGDLVYESKAFVARVAPDGIVTFRNIRVSNLTFVPPWFPVRVPVGVPSLQDTLLSLLQRRRPPVPEPPRTVDESFLIIPNVTPYRPDPREACRECEIHPHLLPLNVTGTYDVTEDLMLFSGADPHRLEKARFLAATREMRVQMALAAQQRWRRTATADLPAELRSIACDRRRARGERRRLLEALRDEMAKTLEGRKAADTVAAFIARFDAAPEGEGCPAPEPAPAP